MNWLKKLMQVFNSEEESPSYTEKFARIEQKNHKHIDTRVTYQYPKGNFRFPMIPDDEQDRVRKEARSSRQRTREQTNNVQQTVQRRSNQEKPKQQPVKTTEKKPFRPTEIPSVIHGFTPPRQKESVIEFELSSSNVKSQTKEILESTAIEVAVAAEVIPTIEFTSNETSEVQPLQEEFKEDKSQLPESLNNGEVVDISDLLVKLKIDSTKEAEEENTIPTIEEEEEEKSATPTIEEEAEEENATPTIEEEAEEENDIPTIEEETENNIERSEPTESVKVDDRPSVPITETRERGRSPIPFNVLMLKKDREKLHVKKEENVQPVEQKREEAVLQPETKEETYIGDHVDSINQEPIFDKEDLNYDFPLLSFLNQQVRGQEDDNQWVDEQRALLDDALRNFKVGANVVNVTQGPAVTRFEVQPEPGVKVNKITNLSDDIKLNLSAKEIRIEAPIPGKNTIGIEVPNKVSKPVYLHDIVSSNEFQSSRSPLTVALGLDISGKPIITDLNKMPHGLIAGATGSGKSVCINTMLVSLMYKASPHEVKLMLIDPKMVELAPYNDIPHLVSPVITDVKAATAALKWAVEEMERRYELFVHSGVRDISRYNELVEKHQEQSGPLPYLVIIIDELADLMMVAPGDVEEAICRIAQKARACGIHLILATQRPSVDVITGLIKANIPTRIAFSVSSQVDSRTIIDSSGAEKLLGKGDMLFLENGSSKPTRVQGNFVSDEEIDRVVSHVKKQIKPTYLFEQDELIKKTSISGEDDELFAEACEFVVEQDGASTSSLQRRFRIGYNRAARLIDLMEEQGIISEARGSKPREILITEEELHNLQDN